MFFIFTDANFGITDTQWWLQTEKLCVGQIRRVILFVICSRLVQMQKNKCISVSGKLWELFRCYKCKRKFCYHNFSISSISSQICAPLIKDYYQANHMLFQLFLRGKSQPLRARGLPKYARPFSPLINAIN